MTGRAKVKKCAPSPVPGDGAAGSVRSVRRRRVVLALAVGGVLAALLAGVLLLQRRALPPSEVWIVATEDPGYEWMSVSWQLARDVGGECDTSVSVIPGRDRGDERGWNVLLCRDESPAVQWFDDTFGTDLAFGEFLGRWKLVGGYERWPDGRWGWRALQCADQEQVLRQLLAGDHDTEPRLRGADRTHTDLPDYEE